MVSQKGPIGSAPYSGLNQGGTWANINITAIRVLCTLVLYKI